MDKDERKQLSMKAGFGQKSINFMGENLNLTAENCEIIAASGSNKSQLQNAVSNEHGITDSYACIYGTERTMMLTNRMVGYNAVIVIHLVQITDISSDIKSLVRDITHNRANRNVENNLKECSESLKDVSEELMNALTKATEVKNKDTKGTKETKNKINEIIDSEIGQKFKEILEKTTKAKEELVIKDTRKNSGRIPEKEQLDTPNLDEENNKINTHFLTNLNTKLTDSTIFNKKARIVKTIRKTLSPSSTYKLTVKHRIAYGIHLNSLVEVLEINPKHPLDYVIVIEIIGDKRGKIETVDNVEDEGFHQGRSPAHVQFEFSNKIKYIAEEKLDGSSETVIYKKKKRDLDYDKETAVDKVLREEFHPDRAQKFNVNFEEIIKSGDRKTEGKQYKLIYDENTINTPSTLKTVQEMFEKSGVDTKFVDENNSRFAPSFAPYIHDEDHSRQPPTTDGPTP